MYETKEVDVREKGEKNSYLQKGEKEKKRAKGLELLLHKNGDFIYIRKQQKTKKRGQTTLPQSRSKTGLY